MECANDYCEIESDTKPCSRCGVLPVVKVNFLTAWLKCPVCGQCIAGSNKREATDNWNARMGEINHV